LHRICTGNNPQPRQAAIFPVKIKFRDLTATIYRPAKGFPFYRLAFKVAGKRRMLTYSAYREAKAAAEKKLRELHHGQQSAALTAKESQDAISIREMLAAYRQEGGARISAHEAVASYLEAAKQLPKGSTLLEAVRVYARTLGSVKSKAIAEAVREFNESRQGKEAKPGERARFSPVYARNVKAWLTKFSETFPGHLVSDLTPDFIEKHLKQFSELSEKARNDRRGAIGMWLRWCGRKDFIESHQLGKLLAGDAMQKEVLPAGKIDFYTPGELRKILDASEGALRVVTALQAFGGARLEEALRLRYEDLHRTLGHIEISGLHAKTCKRRLLEVGSALAHWLAPFKDKTGAIWDAPLNSFITEWARLRESVGVPSKRNGLRLARLSGRCEGTTSAPSVPSRRHIELRKGSQCRRPFWPCC
jgi:hypothetical protein